MPKHTNTPGLEVFIMVNGQPCEEHDDRTPVADHCMERFIVAESGATFEVHFRFSRPFSSDRPVTVVVTIDGKDRDEPLICQSELYDNEGHASKGPISKIGESFWQQHYRFAELEIGEEVSAGDIDAQKEQLVDTGTISLYFYYIRTTCLNKTFETAERHMPDLGPIHEKACKGDALSHTLSLDEAVPNEEIEYFDAEYADNGEAFAVFHFYYRSLKALKDLYIIRHTPEPIDLINCDDEVMQASSPEQLRRMFAHWNRQEEDRQRLKRERSGSETVVGDDEAIRDDDFEVLGAVDLRKERRKRCKPTQQDEVIVID